MEESVKFTDVFAYFQAPPGKKRRHQRQWRSEVNGLFGQIC